MKPLLLILALLPAIASANLETVKACDTVGSSAEKIYLMVQEFGASETIEALEAAREPGEGSITDLLVMIAFEASQERRMGSGDMRQIMAEMFAEKWRTKCMQELSDVT